ncbi:hypothetical protein BEWA_022870 [Theileria equi strain WA]|uniref:Uncharacterized protein n=1 Tax=Theileria equi strain WA TaxID=1537102 RepID=L0AX33_THEEQ|nr:hypothetical protein BEWA_022870 [Theileria equi strain WA]AFZ79439.1 hypothetical protein BEWA_022870 [Theileria equi strain WA]|eukprot:XP_004829105.1 hypothetical protein BEWA_022870 [Theileria equi strain WA]
MGVSVSIQQRGQLKKTALFFAGLGHLQPMLLAATNSDYLLDRFLLEKRCSSEYVSRTVTSLIFIEILATILMGGFGVLLGLYKFIPEGEEEEYFRGCLTCVIQWILFFGYTQILNAFVRGGERGHIQWFYYSLLFQHFFTCIIGAGIGFIDVDRALWYLMNIPVAPVLIFFYQMWIHMWFRDYRPRDIKYLVVKSQIWLGVLNSSVATVLWTIAYFPGLLEAKSDGVTIKLSENKEVNGKIMIYNDSTGGRTIQVKGTAEPSEPPGFCKCTHTIHPGGTQQFRVNIVKDDGSAPLILCPCIEGPVDEVAAYYEKDCDSITQAKGSPLLICVKSGNSYCYYCKGDATYCDDLGHYYCKGPGTCWYRYVYKDSGNCKEIPKDGGTGSELGKLLSVLSSGDKTLTKDKHSKLSEPLKKNFQSDHPNYDYWKILGNHDGGSAWNPRYWRLSQTCMPLIMHGLAVGAMGSIYPHLVPKTLVSAKHARIFDVLSMFLAAIVQILNLIFFEHKSKAFANRPWEGGDRWYLTWLLYIPYFLSFLLIIFNIHYPHWSICCYIRSHTWSAFLVMLSVSFINDLFLAVGRGGIMDQRSGNKGIDGRYLKNDHSLFNKMAPFMALSFIPFWLTTSPMIKSYAHSVYQFLSDKDRDSWPTSRYGFWSLSVTLVDSLRDSLGDSHRTKR